MERQDSSSDSAQVLIAGGGFAAVEAMLALRALAPERVDVTLVSAPPTLAYKPAATRETFDESPPLTYDLPAIAADVGARFRLDRLQAVASQQHRVRLASFAHEDYDALVLAVVARADIAIAGALTFYDQRDAPHVRRVTRRLLEGRAAGVAFAIPHGCCWPLPLYELAFSTAATLRAADVAGEVLLVSPESAPLRVFGAQAAELVAGLLAERGVRFIDGVNPQSVQRDGALLLDFGETVPAGCVVAAPALHGPRISDLPTDSSGFVTTDALGHVIGLSDVYAAGHMTSFPVKQGGLAAQQADLIAQQIAAALGVEVIETRVRHVLRARLLGGAHPIFLRTELDELGQPTIASLQLQYVEDDGEPGSAPQKVFGRYLTPYLQAREPLLAPGTASA